MAEKQIEALKKSGRYVYGVDSNLTEVRDGKQKREWASTAGGESSGAAVGSGVMDDAQKRREQRKAMEEKAIHPSWEARKKVKEAQASINSKPAGKKIRFD